MKDNFHICALSDWMTYGITTLGERRYFQIWVSQVEHSGGDPSGSYMQLGGPDTGI